MLVGVREREREEENGRGHANAIKGSKAYGGVYLGVALFRKSNIEI